MKRHLLFLGVLSAAVLLVYANSLQGTWAMDDILSQRPAGIRAFKDLLGFRKISYGTFLVNQWIAPSSPANYRLFNIALHIMNAVLVYLLSYRTVLMARPLSGDRGANGDVREAAFIAAAMGGAVFALHPLNVNAVAYIIQRMTALATFFVLSAVLAYGAAYRAGGLRSVLLYGAAALLLIAGIFSKENAVMGIPLVILYDYFFLSGRERRGFGRRLAVICGLSIVALAVVLQFLLVTRIAPELLRSYANMNQPIPPAGWTAKDVYWTPLQQLLTGPRVVSRYLALVFLPLPQFLVFDWWGFPPSTGLMQPLTTSASVLFLLALVVFSIWNGRRLPLLSFGILWYLTAISLESFFALGVDFYFEHRNYLPLAGLFVGMAGQLVISAGGRTRSRMFMAAAAAVVVLLGASTAVRNVVWKDSVTLWEDTLAKAPSNLRAMMALGNAYYRDSDFANAERHYKLALNVSSRDRRPQFFSDSAYSLAMMYLFEGKLQPAKEIIDRLGDVIESARPRILMGFYKALNQDPAAALREYDTALRTAEGLDAVIVLTLKGNAYRDMAHPEQAIQQYRLAISREPSFAAAYYGIGASYLSMKNIPLAKEYLEKTLALEPDNVLALSDMADLLLAQKGKMSEAVAYAEQAVSKGTHLYQPYLTMATVLIVAGRDGEAATYFEKAASKGMPAYMVPFSKARAYYMKGEPEKVNQHLGELRRYDNLPDRIRALVR